MNADRPVPRSFAKVLFDGSPTTVLGAAILVLIALMAVSAPLVAPHDPNLQNLAAATKPPMWLPGGDRTYLLGTDNLGRDILSRIIWGARVALVVGLCVVAIGGTLAFHWD
jgi:peptide/nickel transport system permease protein